MRARLEQRIVWRRQCQRPCGFRVPRLTGWMLSNILAKDVRETPKTAHTPMRASKAVMAQLPALADRRILRPAETALALNLITRMDFLRLKAIARLHARGLPADVSWDDLLQEAFTRVIVGTRRKPVGVGMVGFIAGIMRSLRSEHRRRAGGGLGFRGSMSVEQLHDPRADLEQSLLARERLEAIVRRFAGDRVVREMMQCLAEGLSPAQICAMLKLSKIEYDSARKRLRRALLKEGLTCAQN
jgi:DNA-directed RNA polymerase specialized sigma24 family protein